MWRKLLLLVLLLIVRPLLLLVVRLVVAVVVALTLEVAVAVALTEHGACVCVCVCVCAEVFVFALRGGSSKKRELNIVVRIKDAINIGAAAASSSKVVLRRVFLRVHVSKLCCNVPVFVRVFCHERLSLSQRDRVSKRLIRAAPFACLSGRIAQRSAVRLFPLFSPNLRARRDFMPPPSAAGSSPGSRRSSIAGNDGGMLSSDDDETVGRRASGAHPPRPPPLPCLQLAASSPSGPAHSNSVSFAGAAAQPFKAFVRTASGQFNSTLEWMGVQRQPRSVLLHENFERSHFEPPRRRSP